MNELPMNANFFFGCIHTLGPLRNLSVLKIITVDSPKQQLSPGLGKKTDKIKKGSINMDF